MRIGVFDSGIGGITVLSALRKSIPEASYVYVGDTANLPYGTKSAAQVAKLSVACAEFLKKRGVDAVVVACNTASSLALNEIKAVLDPTPVYGVVEPGVQAVLNELSTNETPLPVLVLATRATVRSRAYGDALKQTTAAEIYEKACPLLVPMIEEGWIDHPILHQTIVEYVDSYQKQHPRGIAMLGCTHYPWIQRAVEAALPGWKVVNSAQAVAEALKKELAGRIETGRPGAEAESGEVEWVFTDPDALPAFARQIVGPASADQRGVHE